jgi:site-specific DNA recombinase
VIDEKEAPIRKLIYETYLKTKRKKATASTLNEQGYRTRNGSHFSGTTVARLLRDSTAKGERIANYTQSLGDGKKWVLKPEKDWVRISCPAVVSEQLWNDCNRLLDEQEKKRSTTGPRPVHLLAGYIICHCGMKMYVYHKNSSYRCRECGNKIMVSDIDEIYHDQLKSFLLTETDINEYLLSSNTIIKEKENLLNLLSKQANTLKKRADELVEMRLSGEMPSDSFVRHFHPIDEQYKQAEAQLPEIQAEIDFLRIQAMSSETVLSEAKDLYQKWGSLSIEDKRNIVEVITEGITIGKEDISIKLSYLPFQNGGNKPYNLRGSYSTPA